MRWTFLLITVAFAGCIGGGASEPAGELAISIEDNAEDAAIVFQGAWAHLASATEGGWYLFVDNGTTLAFNGSTSALRAGGDVPAGDYDRVRLLFSEVRVDGTAAMLGGNGIELPVPITVQDGGVSEISVAFDWTEAVYPSAEGDVFVPVLKSLEMVQDGNVVGSIERSDLSASGTKPPVARMRVFDPTGFEVFQSDFVADSPERRVVGTSGTLTFTASGSEAVEKGATITTYAWDFGDGAAEGLTVDHAFPPEGGNFTARLSVTDSEGVTDVQVLKLALLPANIETTFPFSGEASGLDGGSATEHAFPVDAEMTPDGTPANGISYVYVIVRGGALLAGTDIDLRVLDGGGREIGRSYTSATTEVVERSYAPGEPSAPKSGDFIIEVRPDPAVNAPYSGEMTLRWQAKGDPAFIAWAKSHDDGHDHQH